MRFQTLLEFFVYSIVSTKDKAFSIAQDQEVEENDKNAHLQSDSCYFLQHTL